MRPRSQGGPWRQVGPGGGGAEPRGRLGSRLNWTEPGRQAPGPGSPCCGRGRYPHRGARGTLTSCTPGPGLLPGPAFPLCACDGAGPDKALMEPERASRPPRCQAFSRPLHSVPREPGGRGPPPSHSRRAGPCLPAEPRRPHPCASRSLASVAHGNVLRGKAACQQSRAVNYLMRHLPISYKAVLPKGMREMALRRRVRLPSG